MTTVRYPDGTKRMHTIIHQYDSKSVVCSKGIDAEHCPLRIELAKLQKQYQIGFFTSNTGALCFPPFFHSDFYDKDIDIQQLQTEICEKCRAEKVR